jgi:hypothetical protein
VWLRLRAAAWGQLDPGRNLTIGRRSQFLLVLGAHEAHPKTTLYGVVFQKLNGPLLTSIRGPDPPAGAISCTHRGIAARLDAWLAKHAEMPGAAFLSSMVQFAIKTFGFDPDAFIHELVDSIIGDNYPVPGGIRRKVKATIVAVSRDRLAVCDLAFDGVVAKSLD